MTGPPLDLTSALADRYRLDRELGQGGMATVYLAHDLRHDRQVAIKVLRPELAAILGRERFLAEIRLTAKLDHPHILTLIDSGESDGFLWYALPFIRGESLRRRLDREKQLGIEESVALARQIALALDYAHRRGVIHRDIKPENILLHEGEPMLADFGIALAITDAGGERLTETGLSVGTPTYMSPEQATADRQLDGRSDLYSLGALLYEMLAGEPPFTGATAQAVIARLMTERPTSIRVIRDSVSVPLEAVVMKALAKVPADRHQTGAAFAAALAEAMSTTAEPARVDRPPRVPGPVWIGVGLAAAAASLMLVLRAHGGRVRLPAPPVQLTTSGRAYTPVMAPDGSQVAYAAEDCSHPGNCVWSIVVRETAAESERPIVENLVAAFPFQWSRDGLWLLYNGGAFGKPVGIQVVSRLGGTPRLVSDGMANFLPSGDTIIAAGAAPSHGGRVWLRILPPPWTQATDSIGVIPPGDARTTPSAARVSLSGRWLAVGWFAAGTSRGWISIHDRAGQRTDTTSAAAPNALRWSVDSRALLMPIHLRNGNESALIRIAVDPRTGKFGRRDTLALTQGTARGSLYDLSEDGHTLVFDASRRGESSVWTFEQQGGKPVEGRQLASSSQPMGVWITRDGGRVLLSQATAAGGNLQYQWSIAPFKAGVLAPLTSPDSVETYANLDGSRFLTASRLPGPGDRTRIVARDLSGGAPRTVTEIAGKIIWFVPGPSGGLVLVNPSADTIRLLDSLGRQQWQIAVPDSVGTVGSLIPSPDRSEIVFLAQPYRLDVGADGNVGVPLIRASTRTGAWRLTTRVRVIYFRGYVWGDDGWIYAALGTAADPRSALYRFRPEGSQLARIGPIPFPDDGDCELSADARHWACARTESLSDLYLVRNFQAGE
jgi:tRNA A-37 threonylcarbamoyl transferase component Bud32